jgi:hypothetical protein
MNVNAALEITFSSSEQRVLEDALNERSPWNGKIDEKITSLGWNDFSKSVVFAGEEALVKPAEAIEEEILGTRLTFPPIKKMMPILFKLNFEKALTPVFCLFVGVIGLAAFGLDSGLTSKEDNRSASGNVTPAAMLNKKVHRPLDSPLKTKKEIVRSEKIKHVQFHGKIIQKAERLCEDLSPEIASLDKELNKNEDPQRMEVSVSPRAAANTAPAESAALEDSKTSRENKPKFTPKTTETRTDVSRRVVRTVEEPRERKRKRKRKRDSRVNSRFLDDNPYDRVFLIKKKKARKSVGRITVNPYPL